MIASSHHAGYDMAIMADTKFYKNIDSKNRKEETA
jgi:hypothetical protein